VLLFDNVTKDFQLDEETKITAVRSVNLEVESGEFVIIIGRSGTGKTTLLNLAAGLVKPTSGRVMMDHLDLEEMTQKQLSILRSQKIGFIFQFPSLIPALNIRDNVSLPAVFADGKGTGNVNARASNLINILGLAGKLDLYPRQLSAGEQKRVVIARSMINEPEIVLADEPTSDLDNRTEKEVIDFLRDINSKGVTFIIVTHNQQLVPFATRAFEMENGNLSRITAEEVKQKVT
jgi:ABC-type lipoprotein export system ATPase subunit